MTLACKVHAEGNLSYLLSFDYGQRHKKELNFAEKASSPGILGTLGLIINLCGTREKLDFPWKKWCPGADLNHRHADFQSTALPTELPGHLFMQTN